GVVQRFSLRFILEPVCPETREAERGFLAAAREAHLDAGTARGIQTTSQDSRCTEEDGRETEDTVVRPPWSRGQANPVPHNRLLHGLGSEPTRTWRLAYLGGE